MSDFWRFIGAALLKLEQKQILLFQYDHAYNSRHTKREPWNSIMKVKLLQHKVKFHKRLHPPLSYKHNYPYHSLLKNGV